MKFCDLLMTSPYRSCNDMRTQAILIQLQANVTTV